MPWPRPRVTARGARPAQAIRSKVENLGTAPLPGYACSEFGQDRDPLTDQSLDRAADRDRSLRRRVRIRFSAARSTTTARPPPWLSVEDWNNTEQMCRTVGDICLKPDEHTISCRRTAHAAPDYAMFRQIVAARTCPRASRITRRAGVWFDPRTGEPAATIWKHWRSGYQNLRLSGQFTWRLCQNFPTRRLSMRSDHDRDAPRCRVL
jgi:hypothetical protein